MVAQGEITCEFIVTTSSVLISQDSQERSFHWTHEEAIAMQKSDKCVLEK